MSAQVAITDLQTPTSNDLVGEELDRALYDCMTVMWKAYRTDTKTFNSCFTELYAKYSDPAVQRFISGMGMGLVGAVNRQAEVARK